MIRFLALRLLGAVPVIVLVAVIVFLLLRLTPGDPAVLIAGDYASAEQIQQIRAKLGLDSPLLLQLGQWLLQLARGDLGASVFSNIPVATLIGQRLEPTLLLAATTLAITILIAIPLGVLAAWKAGSPIDRGVMVFAVLGFSIPVFVVGYFLIWGLSLRMRWFPVQGYRSPFVDPWGFVQTIALPATALSLGYIALVARITRASMQETLGDDFVRTARAKGQSDLRILFGHALPNAAAPIITTLGVGLAMLIGGVVVTESVFNIPGVGRLVVDAIMRRDYPLIQGLIIFFAGVYILINVLIDLVYVLMDPRIRY